MTELALLAREVGVSERTLRRAVNQGTLRATRPTPRVLRLSLEEQQYIRRSWPLLAAMRSALRTEPNVRFALLFGSAAAGTDGPGSDVDLLVDLADPSLDRLIDLRAKLSVILDRPVDLVRLGDAEADPAFLSDLVDEGRVLIDRADEWHRLKGRQARLPSRDRSKSAGRSAAALAGIDRLLAGRR